MLARSAAVVALLVLLLSSGMTPLLVPPAGAETAAGGGHMLLTDRIPIPDGAAGRPLAPNAELRIALTLEPRSALALDAFDRAVADPHSPVYRHYLSETQFESQFSPAPSNVSSVLSYFSAFGARQTSVTPDRLGVSFLLPAGGAGRAFGTEFVELTDRLGDALRTTTSIPSLPPTVGAEILAVGGLGGVLPPPTASAGPPGLSRPAVAPSPGSFLNGTGIASGSQWFVGSDFAQAYRETALFPGASPGYPNATYPTREAVATLLLSSYNSTIARDLPPWDPTQVDAYFNQTLAPAWPHPVIAGVPVSIDNVTPPPPGSLGLYNDTSQNEEENSLDLEMAGSTAPGAELVNFYFADSLFENTATTFGTLADDFGLSLASALSHNYSPSHLASVSGSFGLPDLNDSLWNTELAHAAAVGVSVIAASGDQANAPDSVSGRSDGAWPSWPASAAFASSGAIAVGGVSLTVSGAATGTFDGTGSPTAAFDAAVGGIVGQSAWYDTLAGPGNISGTEGGISLEFREPSWQFDSAAQPSVSVAAGAQGVLALGRAEPDLSLAANATIAFVRTAPGGGVDPALLEGTSIAAPLFAGLVAEWTAVAGHPFGYLDPELYRIGSYFQSKPGPDDPLLDVVSGHNYAFDAAPGWDATTGWGGVDALKFLAADANATIRGYVYTGPTPGLPPRTGSSGSTNLLLSIPIGLTIAGVIVLWIALERRTPTVIAGRPAPYVPPANAPEGSWFTCPYCGAARPSEPTRCPGCGRY